MLDIYGIGITIKLHDLVSVELLKLSEQFEKLDLLAGTLNKSLASLDSAALGMRMLQRETGNLDTKMARANEQAMLLERNLHAIKAAGAMPPIVPGSAPGLLPSPGSGGGGRRNTHRGLHGGNIHAGTGGVGIGSVGYGLASEAAVPLIAVGAGLYGVHSLYEAAKEYDMALARFKSLNLGDVVNADADKFARETRQFGVSMTERMTILRDMHEVMGNYKEAKVITPLFSRMLAANVGVYGEDGNKFDAKTFQALGKVIEMRGGTSSEAQMFRQADFAQRTLTGSAGLVGPNDLLAFMKTGGVATRLLSDKAFYEESAPMIQEMGGTRFGTSLMSAHQNLAMGRGSLKSMKEAARIGIIDPKMIEYTSIGTIKQVLPGALKDDTLYNTSKFQWLLKDLIPAIRAHGVRGKKGVVTGDSVTDDMIVNELNTLFSQRTASNAFSQMYLQRHKIDKNIGVTEHAMGIDQLEKLNKVSPNGVEKEFIAAWRDFKTEFGRSVLPTVTDMLKGGAEMLRGIQTFVREHGSLVSEMLTLQKDILEHGGAGGVATYLFDKTRKEVGGLFNHDKGKTVAAAPRWYPFGSGPAPQGSPYIAGAPKQPVHVVSNTYLDGRLIGQNVVERIAQESMRPASGLSGVDPRMGFMSPSMAR